MTEQVRANPPLRRPTLAPFVCLLMIPFLLSCQLRSSPPELRAWIENVQNDSGSGLALQLGESFGDLVGFSLPGSDSAIELDVLVSNEGGRESAWVDVEVVLSDSLGKVLGTQSVGFQHVRPGETLSRHISLDQGLLDLAVQLFRRLRDPAGYQLRVEIGVLRYDGQEF